MVPRGKACAFLSDFDCETELFCTLPPPRHLENRVSAQIAERASIAAASRAGQFAHFRVVTPHTHRDSFVSVQHRVLVQTVERPGILR